MLAQPCDYWESYNDCLNAITVMFRFELLHIFGLLNLLESLYLESIQIHYETLKHARRAFKFVYYHSFLEGFVFVRFEA